MKLSEELSQKFSTDKFEYSDWNGIRCLKQRVITTNDVELGTLIYLQENNLEKAAQHKVQVNETLIFPVHESTQSPLYNLAERGFWYKEKIWVCSFAKAVNSADSFRKQLLALKRSECYPEKISL
jgi:hypothetical protein